MPPGAAEPFDKVAPWRRWTRIALHASSRAGRVQFTVSGLGRARNARFGELITSAAHKHFMIEEPPPKGRGPAAYLIGGTLRVVYDELIVQFDPRVKPARCAAIIDQVGFRDVERSRLVKREWIVRHARPGVVGESLLRAADKFARFKEVRFAWPNSVAEYHRANGVATTARRWWLDKIGVNGVNGMRYLAKGSSTVVIAVLDDGVDIEHPNLASRVATPPGRDYAVAANQPGHNDPRPKVQVASGPDSDYHGTQCAGLICSDGTQNKFFGVAPGCTLLSLRVIDGAELVKESWLADAIIYATSVADVISCSWYGEEHAKVVTALNDTSQGRGGKGVAVFCAAGNFGALSVAFPASHNRTIAVGACNHADGRTQYSNIGVDLDIVTPSSNGKSIYTTDVSQPGWGDAAGAFYDGFGGTSAATAIAAGVGALCFSVNPNLTANKLRSVLQQTARPIGQPQIVYTAGHSLEFGHGCIEAAAAVALAKQS